MANLLTPTIFKDTSSNTKLCIAADGCLYTATCIKANDSICALTCMQGFRVSSTQYLCAGTFVCGATCVQSPTVCGTGSIHTPILHATTRLCSPIVCSTGSMKALDYCALGGGWFRSMNSASGMYNNCRDAHFYAAGDNYWHINPKQNQTTGGLVFYQQYNASQGHATGRRGYVYFDSTNNFGLLNCAGAWAFKISGTADMCLVMKTFACHCICSPIVCATTSVKTPLVYATSCVAVSANSERAHIKRNAAYDTLELQGYGAEMMIGSANANVIHINYRQTALANAPEQWNWRCGTSTSWSNHAWGIGCGNTCLQSPIVCATNYVKATNVLCTAGCARVGNLYIPNANCTYSGDGAIKIFNPHGGYESTYVDSGNTGQAHLIWKAKAATDAEFTWMLRYGHGGTKGMPQFCCGVYACKCLQTPILCGTNCARANIICGVTSVNSPLVCGSSWVCSGGTICGVTLCATTAYVNGRKIRAEGGNRRLIFDGSGDNNMYFGPYDDNGWGYIISTNNASGIYFGTNQGSFAFDDAHLKSYNDGEVDIGITGGRFRCGHFSNNICGNCFYGLGMCGSQCVQVPIVCATTCIALGSTTKLYQYGGTGTRLGICGTSDNHMYIGPNNDDSWGYIVSNNNSAGIYFNTNVGNFQFDTGSLGSYTDAEVDVGYTSHRFRCSWVSGVARADGCVYSPIVCGTTCVMGNEVYSCNWLRNTRSGYGLYNQATTQYFYSDDDDWWNIAGGTACNGLRFRDDHNGAIRGSIWANNSNQISLSDSGGNVRILVNTTTDIRLCNHTCVYGNLFVSGLVCTEGIEGDAFSSVSCKQNDVSCFNTTCSTGYDAIYDIYVSANPNSGGSSVYRDVVHMTTYVTTGYSGSAVTKYINTVEHFSRGNAHSSGGGPVCASVHLLVGLVGCECYAQGCNTCLQVRICGGNTTNNAQYRISECVLIKRVL